MKMCFKLCCFCLPKRKETYISKIDESASVDQSMVKVAPVDELQEPRVHRRDSRTKTTALKPSKIDGHPLAGYSFPRKRSFG